MNARELWAAMQQKYAKVPGATCISGRWVWIFPHHGDNIPVGRAVKTLQEHGIVECQYYSGGRAAANLTDMGRRASPLQSGWPVESPSCSA